MSFFKKAKATASLSRMEEEAAYAVALREIESGIRRDGLWAKALAESSGSDEAKGKYIRLRVQAFRDEQNISSYLHELEETEQARIDASIEKSTRDSKRERGSTTAKSGSPIYDESRKYDGSWFEPTNWLQFVVRVTITFFLAVGFAIYVLPAIQPYLGWLY